MTKKYLHCNCKQATCDLKYSYQYCENAGDWELYTIGHHPHIIDHVRQEYGLPLQVKVIIEELLESDPDLKPNDLLRLINKNRTKHVRLDRELKTQLLNDSNYIPTHRQNKINKAYLFDKKIMPDLNKVTLFFYIN